MNAARAPLRAVLQWFDAAAPMPREAAGRGAHAIDWPRVAPYFVLHAACLAVFAVGVSGPLLAASAFSYVVRMFAITGFYHRYFAHRTYRTSRALQFAAALVACTSAQRGPLWWAAHHRRHHAHADGPADPHSPRRDGFWWSHTGWFLNRENYPTAVAYVRDWARYPELRWLDRFDALVFLAFCAGLWALGGARLFVWVGVVTTVVLYHATFTINSLAHRWGTRRFATDDDSRNNVWLALLTLGEGWHNNHHRYPASPRQGLLWWEIDVTWHVLRLLAALRLVRDLRPVPARGAGGRA
jgi:stearoyl-CoA desaturase (delta-9 desaturase)